MCAEQSTPSGEENARIQYCRRACSSSCGMLRVVGRNMRTPTALNQPDVAGCQPGCRPGLQPVVKEECRHVRVLAGGFTNLQPLATWMCSCNAREKKAPQWVRRANSRRRVWPPEILLHRPPGTAKCVPDPPQEGGSRRRRRRAIPSRTAAGLARRGPLSGISFLTTRTTP